MAFLSHGGPSSGEPTVGAAFFLDLSTEEVAMSSPASPRSSVFKLRRVLAQWPYVLVTISVVGLTYLALEGAR